MTLRECQGQFQVAQRTTRQAMSNARTQNSGGGLLGALAVGIAGGASESNDQTKLLVCLQRVGATEAEMRAAVNGGLAAANSRSAAPARATQAPARNVQPRSAICPASGSVLYGGSKYCVR